jgi:hypothetical protein
MNILKKLGIDMRNLFGLIEVDLESDKIVLHIAQLQEDANPLDIMVKSMLVAKVEQAISETVAAVETAIDMAEGVGCIDASEFYDDDSDEGVWDSVTEEEIEAELERNKREIQQFYDEAMANILRKNGRLN